MLLLIPTKKGVGVEIFGDYSDLNGLYSTVHKIADTIDEFDDKTKGKYQILMSFAYEIRKAFELQRLQRKFHHHPEDQNIYQGFPYFWTDLLFSFAILRLQAGYTPLSLTDQAHLHVLEDSLRAVLYEDDPKGATQIEGFIGQRINVHESLIHLMFQGINTEFLSRPPGKHRFRGIPSLIISYVGPFTEANNLFTEEMEKQAKKLGCKMVDLEYAPYPEFEW